MMITLCKRPKTSTVIWLFLRDFCAPALLSLLLFFIAFDENRSAGKWLIFLIATGFLLLAIYNFSQNIKKRQAIYLTDDGQLHYQFGFKKTHQSECQKVVIKRDYRMHYFTVIETSKGQIYAGAYHYSHQMEQNAFELAEKLGIDAYIEYGKSPFKKSELRKIKNHSTIAANQ